jgi:hypothetical protein
MMTEATWPPIFNPQERPMSTTTKIAALALTALTLTSAVVATAGQAQAHSRWGAGLGFGIAAGLLGAAAYHGYGYPAYYGYRRCHSIPQYDAYGSYIGTSRVCDFGY